MNIFLTVYNLYSSFYDENFTKNSVRKNKEKEARKIRRKHHTRIPIQKYHNSSFKKQSMSYSNRRV